MPGDIIGFSCSVELIVGSASPLGPEPINPHDLAAALDRALRNQRFTFGVRGARAAFRVREASVYRVAPTLTAIRSALKLETPWARTRTSAGRRRTRKRRPTS
jgi:hypothetical protein